MESVEEFTERYNAAFSAKRKAERREQSAYSNWQKCSGVGAKDKGAWSKYLLAANADVSAQGVYDAIESERRMMGVFIATAEEPE